MWEGPSWQSHRQDAITEQSPPTKWPRVTTPPNRRQSIFSDMCMNDSGLGDSFYSPPLVQKRNMRVSPLRTPGSTKSSSSFSPFSRFRLSSFSSPTLSARALRLSNSENILDYKFCEDTLDKNRGRVDIGKVASSSSAARSLNLPPANKADSELDIKPDPAILDMLETPSKGFNIEDSGVFDGTFNLFGNSPLKSLFLDSFDISQAGTSSITLEPIQETCGIEQDDEPMIKRIKVEENTNSKNNFDKIFADSTVQNKRIIPFSRRWLRYVTGSTRVQREVTEAAHAFLLQRQAAKQKLPLIPGGRKW